ncbi:MAG: transcriptional regulator, partial [Acidimicrobiales bacterium]
IDLIRLRDVETPSARLLQRFLEMIQVQRQDFNGRVLTIRRDDLRAIAAILETTVDDVQERLEADGLAAKA